MTVYVDELKNTKISPTWPYIESCHLTADNLEELHKFAKLLELKRSWFQNHPVFPHYDITSNKRTQALQLGAEFITTKDYIKKTLNAKQI